MSMNQATSHAIVTCLTAILLLALLHGQRLAGELEEKGLPPVFSSLVRSASDLSPARILDAMRWTANGLASLDRRPGQDRESEPEQPGQPNQPDQPDMGLVADGNNGGAVPAPDRQAQTESPKLPDSQPGTAKAETSRIPALAISHPLTILAGQSLRLIASHQPFGPVSGQDAAGWISGDPASPASEIASGVDKTAKIGESAAGQAESSGQAEKTAGRPAETAESVKTGKADKRKSIFEHPLSRRYKVLLVGDSFMEDITLALMRNFYYKDPYVQYINVARHSTGLCISSKWNWRQKLAGFVSQYKPDVVMIYIGANDLQNIIDDGRRYSFTSDAWKKRYEEIAGSMIDIAASQKADVIWVGMPVMGIKPYETWMPLVSSLQRRACESRKIEYIDTVPTLADANGKYQLYKKDAKGQMVRLRKDDRYHVTYDGCLLILDQIIPSLKKHILNREKKNAISLSYPGKK